MPDGPRVRPGSETGGEGQNYLASVSDLVSAFIFVFIVMIAIFAYRLATATEEQAEITSQLRAADEVRDSILTQIATRLEDSGMRVEVLRHQGVLRLSENAINFPLGSEIPVAQLEGNVGIVARAIAEVVPCYVPAARTEPAGSDGRDAAIDDDTPRPSYCQAAAERASYGCQRQGQEFTRVLHERPQSCSLLVVAPAGLLRNWKDEHDAHLAGDGLGPALEAHGKSLRRLRMFPPSQVRHELAAGRPTLDIGALGNAEWVLTTYETLRDHQHSFGRVRWTAGVFDEAQKIKNPGVRLTEAALALNVDFALLMTGTPVENRPADIWSILDRAEPGSFGSLKDFSARYERANGATSRMERLHQALTAPSTPERPTASMSPALMLRRLKEDRIPDLPKKRLHRRVIDMPPLQADEYEKAVLSHSHGSGMLQALHRLRSISLHPFAPDAFDPDSYTRASARLSETFRILEKIAGSGEKALLFVESREMQNFLIGALRQRFRLRDDVLVINGAVSGRARKARVDTFQQRTGFDVMILSPRAGGVGLTLTAANHVIHLSRWWNPAVEDQCTDRIFRIGQRRTVHVYLPLARHPRFGDYSFDLRLDSLMKRKREMNRLVLAPPAATTTDVQELYRTTMTEAPNAETARSTETAGDGPKNGVDIDLLEPTGFEDWVLRQLAEAGYETRRTPRSGDRGADGLVSCPGDSCT